MKQKCPVHKNTTPIFTLLCALVLCALLAPISVSALSIELVQTNPAPVIAGDYADITVRFINEDKAPRYTNAVFVIEETPFIKPVSNSEYTLKVVQSGDIITHTFRLYFSQDLPEGNVDIPVQVRFDNGQTTIEKDLRIFIEDASIPPEVYIGTVRTTPDELLPDTDRNKLYITLQNLGDKDAELLTAQLVVRAAQLTPSFAYSFADAVATLPAGGEAELEFTMDIGPEVRQEHTAALQLRYRAKKAVGENYDTYTKNIPFVIPISDAPFLRIVNVTYLDAFTTGSTENRVQITIVNEGEEEAEEVRIRALPDVSYPFIFEMTTEYVSAKILPGEQAVVQFKIEVLSNADVRDYPVSVRLESLVGESRYSRDDTMVLTARKGTTISNTAIGSIIVIACLAVASILGIVALRNAGKKTKKKK